MKSTIMIMKVQLIFSERCQTKSSIEVCCSFNHSVHFFLLGCNEIPVKENVKSDVRFREILKSLSKENRNCVK